MTGPATSPPYLDGHGLLVGKTVLVTAAAGAGIGFATAKRCVEEGAKVVVSDTHERRLATTCEQLGESVVAAVRCDVTDEAEDRRGRQQRRPGRYCRHRRHDR